MSGKSLRVFVTGDSPRSIKKITEFNWSGHAFYGTRDQLKQLFNRTESESTGIYFLLNDLDSQMVQMYVGETENFSSRIKSHSQSKDWWTHFIVFQSEGSYLNKAHVRYLEHVFWKRAFESTQIELMNDQSPKEPSLSEEDIADLKIFEDNILYILEALNLGYFTNTGLIIETTSTDPTYKMTVPKSKYEAIMKISGDRYILKAGSHLSKIPRDSFGKRRNFGYYKKWSEITNSSMVENITDKICKLLKDLEFTSPSAAGSMVTGGSTNGATAWSNTISGKTIKEELEDDLPI